MRRTLNFKLVAWLMLILSISACVDPTAAIINSSIRKSEERATQRDRVLLAEHLAMIEKMKAEGDPMGDYLWARAHEDKFIPNPVTDESKLREMYQLAAAKGSLDAQHKLALMRFYEGAAINGTYKKITDAERAQKAISWQQGLKELELATAKQCYHWGIMLDGMANRRCLRPVVTANSVWPKFRDGLAYPKDQIIRDEWEAKANVCQSTLDAQPSQFFFNREFSVCR